MGRSDKVVTWNNYVRYLAAKQSVDDRALNQHVWQTLQSTLPATTPQKPLHVLEIGAGIGTMVERTLLWGLCDHADYLAIDAEPSHISAARQHLARWQNSSSPTQPSNSQLLSYRERVFALTLKCIDLFDFFETPDATKSWDLLIANAFLDLVDIATTLPRLLALLSPGGLFYFTINFDGVTSFQPELYPSFDKQVMALYHRTMDERLFAGKPSGDSHTGRHLYPHLQALGAEILAVGASDWVVFPRAGRYLHDEAYFLHAIIHTVYEALRQHPELNRSRFQAWITERHEQIERGELFFLAHQLDFVGRVRASRKGRQ